MTYLLLTAINVACVATAIWLERRTRRWADELKKSAPLPDIKWRITQRVPARNCLAISLDKVLQGREPNFTERN